MGPRKFYCKKCGHMITNLPTRYCPECGSSMLNIHKLKKEIGIE